MAALVFGDALPHQPLQFGDGPHSAPQRANGIIVERVLVFIELLGAFERHEGKNNKSHHGGTETRRKSEQVYRGSARINADQNWEKSSPLSNADNIAPPPRF